MCLRCLLNHVNSIGVRNYKFEMAHRNVGHRAFKREGIIFCHVIGAIKIPRYGKLQAVCQWSCGVELHEGPDILVIIRS